MESLTNFITLCRIEYISPWTGFELTTLVVISTNCIGSCKSNYHTTTTTLICTYNNPIVLYTNLSYNVHDITNPSFISWYQNKGCTPAWYCFPWTVWRMSKKHVFFLCLIDWCLMPSFVNPTTIQPRRPLFVHITTLLFYTQICLISMDLVVEEINL
jgi:hypothetical protein